MKAVIALALRTPIRRSRTTESGDDDTVSVVVASPGPAGGLRVVASAPAPTISTLFAAVVELCAKPLAGATKVPAPISTRSGPALVWAWVSAPCTVATDVPPAFTQDGLATQYVVAFAAAGPSARSAGPTSASVAASRPLTTPRYPQFLSEAIKLSPTRGGARDTGQALDVTLRQELDGETIIPSQNKGRYLRLDSEGFSAHTPRKEKRLAWGDVTGFKPANVKMATIDSGFGGSPLYQIGFFLRNPPRKGRVGRWFVRRVYRVDDTLPGVYPDAEEIVELMERWRQRYSWM